MQQPRGGFALAAILLLLWLAACAPIPPRADGAAADPAPPSPVRYEPVSHAALRGWPADRMEPAVAAFRESCRIFRRRAADSAVEPARLGGRVRDWLPACAAADRLPPGAAAARSFFERWFQPWRPQGDAAGTGLFTGYFEPELRGARRPGTRYRHPLYRRPRDLVLVDLGRWRPALKAERIAGRIVDGRLVPYDSRAEIAAGSLAGRAEPLLWLDDPIDLFFLHIQGSGRVGLDDGSVLRVGYDGHNGHNYYPIGRHLIEQGEIPRAKVSLQTIRAWLRANPDRRRGVLNRNPSYIFFREMSGPGPVGTLGAVLTPGRSLAVDRRHVPLGAPVWVDIEYADETGRPLRRLMVAQDTGGAIRGVMRGDVFWGRGAAAERLAGGMAAKGRLYVLRPRPGTPVADAGGV